MRQTILVFLIAPGIGMNPLLGLLFSEASETELEQGGL
jgi:hypothetical protein